jgi:hypothetical protein
LASRGVMVPHAHSVAMRPKNRCLASTLRGRHWISSKSFKNCDCRSSFSARLTRRSKRDCILVPFSAFTRIHSGPGRVSISEASRFRPSFLKIGKNCTSHPAIAIAEAFCEPTQLRCHFLYGFWSRFWSRLQIGLNHKASHFCRFLYSCPSLLLLNGFV